MIFDLLEDFADALGAAPAGWAEAGPGEFFRFVRSRQHLLAEHPDLTGHWAANQHTFPAVRRRALDHRAAGAGSPWLRSLTRGAGERRLLTVVAHPAPEEVPDPGKPNRGSPSQVWDCKWSPAGRHIASATRATVRLWDARTGRLCGEMPGRRWCAFSPDGRLLIAPDGPAVRVLDTASGAQVPALNAPSEVNCCVFCPMTRAVIGLGEGALHLWRGGQHSSPGAIDGRVGYACAVSADGRRLAASAGRAVRTWDTATWQPLATSDPFPVMVFGCGPFAPDGRTLYVSGLANEFRGMTWALDAATLRKVRQIGAEPGWEGKEMASKPAVRCAVSPDGERLAAGTEMGGRVCVWDTATGREVDDLPVGAHVWGCDYSPDGTEIVSGDRNGHLHVWDARADRGPAGARPGPVGKVLDLDVAGRWAATLTASFAERAGRGEVYLWDLESGSASPVASLPFSLQQGGVLDVSGRVGVSGRAVTAHVSLSFPQDRPTVVPLPASPRDPHQTAGRPAAGDGSAPAPGAAAARPACLPDGWPCRVEPDGRLTTVDPRTGRGPTVGPARPAGRLVEFSPDGRRCLFATPAGRLVVEDARTGLRLLEVVHAADRLRGPILSPDGRFLLAVTGPKVVEVWSIATGRPELKTATPAAVNVCAWGLVGTRLVVADDQGAMVFDVEGLPSGPPVVTAVVPFAPRLSAGWIGRARTWAGRVLGGGPGPAPAAEFQCPWGSPRVPVPGRVLEAIADIHKTAALPPDQSPALHLPDAAFDDARLRTDCPACGRPLQFNPFLVDGNPVRPAG